jgi:hypothetical protein
MNVTELERSEIEEPSNDSLEALGETLRHAFPLSECRSFTGLMHAIDPDREACESGHKPFLLNFE